LHRKNAMKYLRTTLLACSLLLPAAALTDTPGDTRAIAGMETGRIMWDITIGDPDRLIGRLDVIEQTFDDMVRQGLKPDMVFGFRGGAAGLIATSTDRNIEHIHERLQRLLERDGIHMEACSLATQRFGLAQKDLLPGIHLVGNTFLSIMGYEHQGYATIRLD